VISRPFSRKTWNRPAAPNPPGPFRIIPRWHRPARWRPTPGRCPGR
jgi:hypothetical protein